MTRRRTTTRVSRRSLPTSTIGGHATGPESTPDWDCPQPWKISWPTARRQRRVLHHPPQCRHHGQGHNLADDHVLAARTTRRGTTTIGAQIGGRRSNGASGRAMAGPLSFVVFLGWMGHRSHIAHDVVGSTVCPTTDRYAAAKSARTRKAKRGWEA